MRMAALLIDTSVTHLRLGSPYMHVPALVVKATCRPNNPLNLGLLQSIIAQVIEYPFELLK
jgi:hypothetical protein